MPTKQDSKRRKIIRQKERKVTKGKNPMLAFCLFGEEIEDSRFDSTRIYHKNLMSEIGPVALIPFSVPLKGRRVTFEVILSGGADYLVLHSDEDFDITAIELNNFVSSIKNVRRQKSGLNIFATPFVATKMNNLFNFTAIEDPSEVAEKIRRNSHGTKNY